MEELREDELLVEEAQEEAPQQTEISMKPRQRRPQKTTPVSVFLGKIVAYFAGIGKDVKWYYDIRLWSPLILLLLILALLPGKGKSETPAETIPETQAVVMETEPEVTEPPATEPVDPRAEALARLADTVGAGRSDNVKTVIMWVAINREEDRANGYGKDLLEEIARPNQWQGYDENASYTDHTYDIAKQVLEAQESGALRPVDSDMLWFVLNDNGSISLRNLYAETATQKWRTKTVK